MTLYCDESDDGATYALAGWLASPTGWKGFDAGWRAMLQTLTMPDGSPCSAFHAREIANRDLIPDSPFKGWTFEDEKRAFTKATDVIYNKNECAILWPVGAAAEIPKDFKSVPRDSIWLMLFTNFFRLIRETYTAQRSIAFVFDEKPSIARHARTIHQVFKGVIELEEPDVFEGTLRFAKDEEHPGLQAADLLAYEWRKRISDARQNPGKPVRKSYERIRASRNEGALWRYGREVFDKALDADDQSATWARFVMWGQPSHRD